MTQINHLHCMKIWLWPTLIHIKSVSKLDHYFWHTNQRWWSTLDIGFDVSQRWARLPLMHAVAIFDKIFDHFWFDLWLKSKMAFDSRQKWSKVWSNMAFDTFDICQRRGAKAIFCAVLVTSHTKTQKLINWQGGLLEQPHDVTANDVHCN